MTEVQSPKKSDLGVRALSAVVMIAVAGSALWLGGWVWMAFVALVAFGVLGEWWGLVRRFAVSSFGMAVWLLAGAGYVGVAIFTIIQMRQFDPLWALLPILLVIGVDVGGYFVGRTLGGPKIAPLISPSKTWSGLLGGASGAAMIWVLSHGQLTRWLFESEPGFDDRSIPLLTVPSFQTVGLALVLGLLIAVIAQTGDFFESWMKRRAGVKDSGDLIPGHGGLFDRLDGLLAVLFVGGLLWWALS